MQIKKRQILLDGTANKVVLTDGDVGLKALSPGDSGQYLKNDSTWGTPPDTYDRMHWNNVVTLGDTLHAYKIIMQSTDGKFYPLTTELGTAENKTVSTKEFVIDSPILHYTGTQTLNVNSQTSNLFSEIPISTLNYTANQSTFIAQKNIYLKGTITSSGTFKLDNTSYTSWLTQTLPTTNDKFVYILLGWMYSTTNLRLLGNHPVLHYRDGAIRSYTHITTSGIPFVSGTQTANTKDWTGNLQDRTELKDGDRICFWLPYNSTTGSNLKLKLTEITPGVDNFTDALPVYYGGTTILSTQYPAGSMITLTYRYKTTIGGVATEYTGWWCDANYFSDTNTWDRSYWGVNSTAGAPVRRYALVMQSFDGKFYPLTIATGDTVVTNKDISTVEFAPDGVILYYAATTNIATNGVFSNLYSEYPITALGYAMNTATWTAQKNLYMKCTIGPNGGFILDNTTLTSCFTQTLPTTDDGFVYIHLGFMYSTTALNLLSYNKVLHFKDGTLRRYQSPHTHGNITNTGAIGTTPGLIVKTGTNGVLTTLTSGTTGQYLKHDGTWGIPPNDNTIYSLPEASTTTLGGIKVGNNLTISNGVLSADVSLNSPIFTGTPKTVTATAGDNSTQIANTAFVKTEINNILASSDAMIFKGTLGTGGTVTSLPTIGYKIGWTYKVITGGTYAGNVCEIGDMLVCVVNYSSSFKNTDWTVIQSNIDGAVIGPVSAVDNRIATFNSTTGKIIKDSGYTIETSVPSGAIFTDNNVTQTATTTNAIYPILLTSDANKTTTSTNSTRFVSGVNVNPSTNTIYATTFNGNLTGNADTATKLNTINTTFNGTFPMVANVNGVIYSNTGITYTGLTNTLTTTNFIGNLTGNVTGTATLSTTSTTTADTTNELILVGVTAGATTTLKRDTSVTVTNDSIKANNFKMGTSAYMTYNSSTECIEFIFN